MILGENKAITEHFLQTLDIKRINKFDDEISELFQNIFYSFSHDVNIDVDERGIVSHFLKNWKDTVGVSNISTTLPAIITGSIVEGACLSRLFHPSHEKSLELEADVMFIVGCIDQQTANQCFENIGKTGFLKVRFSPDIKLFTNNNLPSLNDIKVPSLNNNSNYIDGSQLKIMHKNRQPNDRRLQFNQGTPYLVSVQQKISGPSSEIIFQTQPIHLKNDVNKVVKFLERVYELLVNECDNYVEKYNDVSDLYTILHTIVEAMVQGEKNRLCQQENEEKVLISLEEARGIMQQVDAKLVQLDAGNEILNDRFQELSSFMRSVVLLCYDHRDRYFSETISLYLNRSLRLFDELRRVPRENPMNQEVQDDTSLFSKASVTSTTLTASYVSKMGHLPDLIKQSKKDLQHKLELLIDQVKKKNNETINENEGIDSISFDNVSCFYCPFWPNIAAEWKERKRCWPSKENIGRIISDGTYIVSKPSQEGEEHFLEWRWSFSSAEIELAKLRSHTMKYCYFIFKSLFYQYFKDFPGAKSLPSYVAKTCMLLLSEQNDEEWWDEVGITTAVIHLFKYLQKCLQAGFLTHYFIDGLNLLADSPDTLIKQAEDTVARILEKPASYLKINRKKLTTIEKLEKEVNMLTENNSNPKSRSPREHYQYVTTLYKERPYLIAACTRSAWLCELYGALGQKILLGKLVDAQEKMLADKRGTGSQYDVIDRFYHQNKMVFLTLETKIKSLRSDVEKSLREIGDLLEIYCKKCDGCLKPIPCGSKRYKCSQGCDYDLCNGCHENGVPLHEHDLSEDNECSPYCFTQFTHERLGNDHLDEGRDKCMKNVFDIRKKVSQLGSIIGYGDTDMCSLFLDHGCIMNKQYKSLFQALDKSSEQAETQPTDCENEQDLMDQVAKHSSNTYEQTIQDITNYFEEYKKRKYIEEFMFGA